MAYHMCGISMMSPNYQDPLVQDVLGGECRLIGKTEFVIYNCELAIAT